ncbi:MAG TPA: TolC family protein [Gemmatimonadaceae bacterium]|nr:TolC family protein [Gemmatimonadaceae bacterium]
MNDRSRSLQCLVTPEYFARRTRRGAAAASRVPFIESLLVVTVLGTMAIAHPLAAQSIANFADSVIVLSSAGAAARIAAAHGVGVEEARLRVEQAEARIGQERAGLLPSASLEVSDGRRTFNTASFGIDFPTQPGEPPLFDPEGQVEGPVRTVDIRGRVTAPLLNLSALARVHSARAEARATEAASANSARSAALSGAMRFVRAVRAQSLIRAREADSTLATELLGIARSQLAAGVGVGLDVTRAQAQVARAHADLISARIDRDRARLELARALGIPLDSRLALPDSLPPPAGVATVVPDAVDAAVRQRADVRAADLDLEAARRDVTAIRAERLPVIGVFADDGRTGLDYSTLLETYTYGVQLTIPVFEGLHRHNRIAEQRAIARELDVHRRDLRQQVALEVQSATLELDAAAGQVEAARGRLRLAELEVSQARDRFTAGVSGNADIASALLSLNQARTALINVLAAAQEARVALAAASGTITDLP